MHLSLSQSGSLLGFLRFLLRLPELGQVEGSDLLGFLDLLLVSLDLLLELGGQLRHPVLVLLILLNLESEFLGATLRLLISLGALPSVTLHVTELHFQLPDPRLQLSHGSAAATDRVLVGLGKLAL